MAWADLPLARIHWKDSAAVGDPIVTDLLTAAYEQLLEFAPTLAEGEPVPFRYKLANVYQARELYNAGQRGEGDVIGTTESGFPIIARPLITSVRGLLRPKRVTWRVG